MRRIWLTGAALALAGGAWIVWHAGETRPSAAPPDRTLAGTTRTGQPGDTGLRPTRGGPAPGSATNRPSSSGFQQAETATAITVGQLMDQTIPVERRLAQVELLARKADAASARTLMALADRDTQLNAAAIEALGRVPAPGVPEYLASRLTEPDPRLLAAAVRSLGRAADASAIAAIADTLRRNRRREDGYQDTVCTACVEALGAIGSPAAVPALAAELEETVGHELQHEYGSAVVAALRRIGSVAARSALDAYAQRLEAELERSRDNPLAIRYLERKISEIKEAVGDLKP